VRRRKRRAWDFTGEGWKKPAWAGLKKELGFTGCCCEEEQEEFCGEGFGVRTLACYEDPKEEDWKEGKVSWRSLGFLRAKGAERTHKSSIRQTS
jgi:hypothetical protein